jgi:hypothetical protein
MTRSQLNLVMAVASFVGSVGWFAIGQNPTGLIWFIGSLIWLIIAICRMRDSAEEPRPLARLARRLSRLLLWS